MVTPAAAAAEADGEGLQGGRPEPAVVKVGRESVVPRRCRAGQDPRLGDRLLAKLHTIRSLKTWSTKFIFSVLLPMTKIMI